MADKCRCLWRVFSANPGLVQTSKSFVFICQRNLSQSQANDARKLRAMVIIFMVIFLSLIKLSCYKLELRRLWQTIVGQGTPFSYLLWKERDDQIFSQLLVLSYV